MFVSLLILVSIKKEIEIFT